MNGPLVQPGYYVGLDNVIFRVTTNRAGNRSYAERMIFEADADGCKIIRWVYAPGLGVDLLLSPMKVREVSWRIRQAVAA